MFPEYYEEIASGHRRMAAEASTDGERAHWVREATRFDSYARCALNDPAYLLQIYRPTQSYKPTRFTSPWQFNTAQIADALNELRQSLSRDDATIKVAEIICEAFPSLSQGGVLDVVWHVAVQTAA